MNTIKYFPKFMGSWYPKNYKGLITKLIKEVPKKKIKAIIVPHAGYKYSKYVLGETYSQIDWTGINKIVLLCTLHQVKPFIYLPKFDEIQLKDNYMKINKKIIGELSKIEGFVIDNSNEFDKEHSFELQLPFILSLTNKSTTLIPLLVGNFNNLKKIAESICYYINDDTLVIISTDFTHYGTNYNYFPVDKDIKKYILDKDIVDFYYILNNNIYEFKELFEKKSICGIYALELWMYIRNCLNINLFPKLIAYNTSGDELPETKNFNSVSYSGMGYYYQKTKNNIRKLYSLKKLKIIIDELLDNNQKINLRELIKDNISILPRLTLIIMGKLFNTNFPSINIIFNKVINVLNINLNYPKKGVFITFEDNLKLQGCLGIFYDEVMKLPYNMIEIIILYTIKTIFEDSRFKDNSLRHYHNYIYLYSCERFNFKINLLEKNILINNEDFWNKYKPCKHGVILKFKENEATFLPSVMIEQGWLKDCQNNLTDEDKLKLEINMFGSLIRKMEYDDSWENWRKGQVLLYEGNEISEIF